MKETVSGARRWVRIQATGASTPVRVTSSDSTAKVVPPTRARTSLRWNVTVNARGHGLERSVAGEMPQTFVQLLDIAHVDVQDGDQRVLPVRPLQQVGAGGDQAPPVLESGQVVDPRELEQAGAELLHLALDRHAARNVPHQGATLGRPVLGLKRP